MKFGSMKEVFLDSARDTYLFDCRVAGLDAQALNAYRTVLGSFILFTGNILVKQLTPDHVRMYIANLSDGPSEGEEHIRTVINHYTVIHDWVRWLYAQKFITERNHEFSKSPRHLTRRLDLWLTGSPAARRIGMIQPRRFYRGFEAMSDATRQAGTQKGTKSAE